MLKAIKEKQLSILSWLILILSIIATYSNMSNAGFMMFLNSDALGIPDLYNDVIIGDGKIKDWIIAASTQIFPDGLLYLLVAKLFHLGVLKTAFIYGIAQVVIVTLLLIHLYKKLVNENLKKYSWLIPIFISMFFMESFYFTYDPFLSFLLVSYIYHFGVLINTLIFLCIYFSSFKKPIKYFLLFVFSIVGGLSDKLFLVLLIAPFFLTVLVLIKKEKVKEVIFSILAVILGCVAGFFIYDYIKINRFATFQEIRMNLTMKDILFSVDMFVGQMLTYMKQFGFKSFQIIFTFVAVIGCIIYYFKNRKTASFNQLFLIVFFVFFSCCTFCAPIVNGSYTGYDTLRYNAAPFYMAAVIFALFFGSLLEKDSKGFAKKLVPVSLISVFLLMLIFKINSGKLENYFNYYPEEISEIDSVVTKYNLKKGIGSYWLFRPVNLFTKKNVTILSAFPEGNMNELGTNINGFYKGEFNFIVTYKGMAPEVLQKYFTIKDTIITKHHLIVLVDDFIYPRGEFFPKNVSK